MMTQDPLMKKPRARPRLRLFVPEAFTAGQSLELSAAQSHYVAQVMRARTGEAVALFNGQDGEWLAEIRQMTKKTVVLAPVERLREQKPGPDLWLAFAPVKNKVDVIVEKAVELGVSALLPVFTRHAVVTSLNHAKLAAYAVEAAEQCERLDVPRIQEFRDIPALLADWPTDRLLLHADESGGGADLRTLLPTLPAGGKLAVLIGPEGGFAQEERDRLRRHPAVRLCGLGPRVLRSDTAVVAALACVQAWLGDWQEQPRFETAYGHG